MLQKSAQSSEEDGQHAGKKDNLNKVVKQVNSPLNVVHVPKIKMELIFEKLFSGARHGGGSMDPEIV